MRQVKMGAVSYGAMCKLMCEGTYSCAEMAEMTGLHYVTVLQYAREIHKAGAAHIASWETDSRGRDCVRIYKLGEGVDTPRKKPRDKAKTNANRRLRRQQLELIHRMAS
jgi:hypothetical protein